MVVVTHKQQTTERRYTATVTAALFGWVPSQQHKQTNKDKQQQNKIGQRAVYEVFQATIEWQSLYYW
jgi:hypothetical protein